jgi:polygalacturonase
VRPLPALLFIAFAQLAALPNIYARDFNVKKYGAKGDGITLDTHAIQAAIDAATKAGGGTIVLPQGMYLSGSIFVKSNTDLRLDKGATILGSQKLADYPMMPTRVAGIEMTWPAALVNVYQQSNAKITGQGTIDGDGKIWWDSYWALRRQYDSKGLRWAADYDSRRPRLIQIYKSSNVTLSGPLLTRSGFWTVHICYSNDVEVDGVTIRNNVGGRGPSTDGIDIDSSRNILVEHADISDNDDAICFKAGRDSDGLRVNRPTEDVVVRDSVVRDGAAAVTFGSETSGGFRNIEVYNIHAFGHVPNGILFKSARTRGGWADDIRIHDLQLEGVPILIHIGMNWNPSYSYAKIPPGLKVVPPYYKILATPVPLDKGMMHIRNVHIWNIQATGARRAFDVSAFPQAPLEDFTLVHITIQAKEAGTVADAQNWTLSHVIVDTATFSDSHAIALKEDSGINSPAQQ